MSRDWARKAWGAWIWWAMRSRLEPVKRVARMIRTHLEGIINGIVHQATNVGAESINAKIKRVKRMACGFRNRERFRNAIYFLKPRWGYPRCWYHGKDQRDPLRFPGGRGAR